MEELVKVDVTSAFMCGGEMALPGETVDLPRAEALVLMARGKVVLRDLPSAEGEASNDDEAVPTLPASDALHEELSAEAAPPEGEPEAVDAPAARAPRGKGKRGQG